MKRSLMRFLICPGCRDGLELQVTREVAGEVLEGSLRSPRCGSAFPITKGVPRFVDTGAYASSFGFQWNRFREIQIDSRSGTGVSEETLAQTTGWTSDDYRGQLVLDAGVGAGRFAEIVARKGGEVVGVDLTDAIDAAYENIGSHERVHLVQADIFAMPFREHTFDRAYSIGVLHHTPDPRAAFERVASTVRPGGQLAVYLYANYGPSNSFSDAIRKVTTRLPLRMMLALSSLAIPLYYVYRVPILGKVLAVVCPIAMYSDWRWRWLDTFDWYTPKYQFKYRYPEIFRWFREAGFEDLVVFDDPIRMRGAKRALRRESAA
jgi:SAM-dependent methyltransferase